MKCEKCMFWVGYGNSHRAFDATRGECYRYPPSSLPVPVESELKVTLGMTITTSDHWCGEYKRSED